MFDFFKKNHQRAKALSQIGNSFDYLSIQLKRIPNISAEEADVTILFLTYFQQKEIYEKMDEYGWSFETKLFVPDIAGSKWITIGYAFTQTTEKINFLAVERGLTEEVQEILEEGELYEEMKKLHIQVLKEISK